MSPIPPDEYAARFVKFIRTNVKTREDVAREKTQQVPAVLPLSAIEEQEDGKTTANVRKKVGKTNPSHEEKEKDIGKTIMLTPTREKSEQVIPSLDNYETIQDADKTISSENGLAFTSVGMAKNAQEEVNLKKVGEQLHKPN